jgi:DNA invertase Pin-like site-specific DNA recombinase
VIDLYCRISKDYDGTLRSVEDQEEEGRRWVAFHAEEGYVVGMVHRDHALSGWNPKVKRPSWDDLMGRLRSGEAGGVWVRDLDRFTRKMRESVDLADLAKAGTVVADGDGTYNLNSAEGLDRFYRKAVRAEVESQQISDRSVRGKKNKAKRGKSNASYRGFARDGYGPPPEGWEPGDPREPVDPAQLRREQQAVRDAAARILAGETLQSIVKEWNAEGLLTVKGKLWDGTDLRQLLTKSTTLAGLISHQGQIIGKLDGEHALDEETWRRLQSHFASRKRGRPVSSYLLSGLLTCGHCGGTLYGRPQKHRQPYPDGETRRQYWCMPRPKTGGCGRLCIDQRFADAAVTEVALEVLGDPRHADRLARVAAKVQEARSELLTELHRLEEDAQGIATKTATRGLAWVDAAMEPIDARMAELRDQLDRLEVPDETAAVDASRSWEDAKLSEKRAMIRRAFPRGITIRPATSRGKGSLTPDRFDFGQDLGSDQGGPAKQVG